MTSNTLKLSPILRGYKAFYGFVNPILGALAVICAVLCCFKSEEGSNSRMISAIIFLASVIFLFINKWINKSLEKSNATYRMYRSKLVQKMEPRVMIPLCIMVLTIAVPFYILIVTALKNPIEANQLEFTWYPTEGVDLSSFAELFSHGSSIGITMGQAILNSFVYAIIPTVIGLFVAALSAYAFSKLYFKGRKQMYQMLIMTMMMPSCVTMTTAYIMYDLYGWTNTALPIVVPGFFSGAATVMFLREYFMGIPDGLLEAARIDGAGKWKIFFVIMIPLAKPALMAQFVLGFITRYNDFLAPLIYLNKPSGYTIQVALSFLNGSVGDKSLIASASVFALAPMLLLYIIFQKRIIDGISMSSGIKG